MKDIEAVFSSQDIGCYHRAPLPDKAGYHLAALVTFTVLQQTVNKLLISFPLQSTRRAHKATQPR